MAAPRYNTRELTKYLRELAVEAETVEDGGDVVTKAKALAALLWKKALGYTEMAVPDGKGGRRDIAHSPEAWAIQLIYERLEGRVANAAGEEAGKTTAADRVSDLSRNRINALSGAGAVKASPPKILPPKGKQ